MAKNEIKRGSVIYFAEVDAGLLRWWLSIVVSVSGCMISV
jgi:hypothetical protein